jgi:hypothetical protein
MHTKGNWIVERGINDYDIVVLADGRAPVRLCGYIERESDADLLAASPKLLWALTALTCEVKATLSMAAPQIEHAAGRANTTCLLSRLQQAEDILKELRNA